MAIDYQEWKKKRGEDAQSSSSPSQYERWKAWKASGDKSSSFSVYEKKQKMLSGGLQPEDEAYNTWLDALSAYADRTAADYTSRENQYQSRSDLTRYNLYANAHMAQLLTGAEQSRNYYEQNRELYDEIYGAGTVDSILSQIAQGTKYLDDVKTTLKGEYDYWGQWDDESTYRLAVQAAEEQEQRAQAQAALISEDSEGYRSYGDNWARYVELSQRESLTKEEKAEAKAALRDMQSKYHVVDQSDVFYTDMPRDMEKVYINLQNKSNWGAGVTAGFMDAFGADWFMDKGYELLGKITGQDYTGEDSVQDQFASIQAAHPGAYAGGNIAGNLAALLAGGELVSAGTSAISGFSKLAPVLQNAIRSGATFGLTGGYQAATSTVSKQEWDANEQEKAKLYAQQGVRYDPVDYNAWGQVGDVLKQAGISTLGGAAGSFAGSLVGDLGKSYLVSRNLQTPFAEALRQTLSGTAFAAGNMASTYWLYPAESRPSKEKIAQDLAVAFLFSAITSTISTAQTTKANKAFIDNAVAKMKQDYQSTLNSNMTPAEQVAAFDDILAYNANIRAAISQNYYAGQQKYIDEILRGMDAIDEQITIIKNGVAPGNAPVSNQNVPSVVAQPAAPSNPVPAAPVPQVEQSAPSFTGGSGLIYNSEQATLLSQLSNDALIVGAESSFPLPLNRLGIDAETAQKLKDAGLTTTEESENGEYEALNESAIYDERARRRAELSRIRNDVSDTASTDLRTVANEMAGVEDDLVPNDTLDTQYSEQTHDNSNTPYKTAPDHVATRQTAAEPTLPSKEDVLATIKRNGAVNVPYEKVLDSTNDAVSAGVVTAQEVSDAYASGLAEYNKKSEQPTLYSGEKNNLPYDIVIEKIPVNKDSERAELISHVNAVNADVYSKEVEAQLSASNRYVDNDIVYRITGSEQKGYTAMVYKPDYEQGISDSRSLLYQKPGFRTRQDAVDTLIGVSRSFAPKEALQESPGIDKIPIEEQNAIRRYKSGKTSYVINEKLYTGVALDDGEEALAGQIDSALDKLPDYKGTTYRVLGFDRQGKAAYDAFIEQHQPGKPVIYESYSSSSKSLDAYDIDNTLKVRIEIDGQSGKDISQGFGLTTEQEVLFKRGLDVNVVSVETDSDGNPYIKVKEFTNNVSETGNDRRSVSDTSERGSSVRNVQELHRLHPDVQGIPERDTERDTSREDRPQQPVSGGQRDSLRPSKSEQTSNGALREEVGGTQNVETEISADERSAIQPPVPGQAGRGLVEGVLQTELSESGSEGAGSGVPVLPKVREESAGRASGTDAARRSGGRSAGDSEGVPIPEGRGEHEVTEQVAVKEDVALTSNPKGNNFSIGESLDLPSGEKSRYKANIEAIRIVKNLIQEDRFATSEEQQALSKYVGWGGLANAFDSRKPEWADEFAELKEILTDDEYKSAKASTLNAHYTSIDVIKAMYDGLSSMGFVGGRVLEPSCGIGHFAGAMPANIPITSMTMVELDPITGSIAKYLYPNYDVRVQGFESATIPNNYMDVAIGNVPFGNYAITDKAYPKQATSAIHNYFFAKSLDKVRPGGIVAFITSRYTMDARNAELRKYLMDKADFLGAVRLPDTAFKGNAGTEVVTDIIVLKKREAMTKYSGLPFESVSFVESGNSNGYINQYFADHPEMVLGTLSKGTMYQGDGLTWKALPGDLSEQIVRAFAKIDGKIDYPKKPTVEKITKSAIKKDVPGAKEGSFVSDKGKIYQVKDGELVEQSFKPGQTAKLAKIIAIRDIARSLLNLQVTGGSDAQIKTFRNALTKAYNDFVKENGALNLPANKRLYESDSDYPFICALENYNTKTKVAKKADIFTQDTASQRKTITHVENINEGLIASQNMSGRIDVPLIAKLYGRSETDVIKELLETELAYKNRKGELETAEQYLSGNVRAKLKEAQELSLIDDGYKRNVEALKKIIPVDVPSHQIYVQPGATWIPAATYEEFVGHMLNSFNYSYGKKKYEVIYSPYTGEFKVDINDKYLKRSVDNTDTWGTPAKTFRELLEATMNNRTVTVTRKDAEGKSFVDKPATIAARAKVDEIKAEFQKWLWDDAERTATLSTLYNDMYNGIVPAKYDGTNLVIDGMSTKKQLREHQKDVVQRVIMSGGNTLIAHKVGAGKTAEMAGAAMKLRQLGIINKPMFVVPKSVLGQWGQEFLSFFPAAKVLVPNESDFTTKNRKIFLNRIATGDYDAVIVSYENFKGISLLPETEAEFISKQIAELEVALEQEKRRGSDKNAYSVKQIEKSKKSLEAKLKKLIDIKRDDIYFEQLGVDSLFVDEAHNFKNLFYATHMNNVKGLGDKKGSERSFDLYMKTRYLQKLNGGRGIVFATATPVMNSMSEMYIMQKYLQEDMLTQRGITTFDAWANLFGEVSTVMELNPSGKGYRTVQSFSKFKNMPELQQLFRSFTDVLTDVPGLKIPTVKGGKPTVVVSQPSQYQLDYIDELQERAEAVRSGKVDPKEDNMLKITSDGKKLSLSQRMIDPSLPYEPEGKIAKLSDNVYDIWKRTKTDKLTQLIFLDLSTPKGNAKTETDTEDNKEPEDVSNVSVYQDIKKQLILRGIPAKEIAFIHDAKTKEARSQLMDDFNDGLIRVLIGSTAKMGVGVNAQKRTISMHHPDAPWRPGDLEQRNGRGLRQGNINDEIEIYYYVTEKTFDARLWDTLERKAGFIDAVMNGDTSIREMEEVGDTQMSFAEIKSIATGNPLIMEQFEVSNKITELTTLKRQHTKAVQEASMKKRSAESNVAIAEKAVPLLKKDVAARVDVSGDSFAITIGGKDYTERKAAGEAIITAAKKAVSNKITEDKPIGKFAGFELLISPDGEALIRGKNTYTVKINPESATGTMQSLENALRNIGTRLTAVENSIEAYKSDIAKLDAVINAPFAKQADLDKAIARNNEILQQLSPDESVVTDDEADESEIQAMVSDEDSPATQKWDTVRVGAANKKTMPISDILNKMRHDFGIPVGKGRMSRGDILGQYNTQTRSIKTRITNDLPTVSHELGHHLDNMYKLTTGLSKALKDELSNNITSGMKDKIPAASQVTEGLAEFIRRYLQNSETTAIDYPLFTPYFRSKVGTDGMAVIDGFADEINAYFSLDAETAQSSIRDFGEGPRDFRTTGEKTSDAADKAYQAWIDSFHGIKLFDRAAGTTTHMLAINSAYADSVAYSILTGDLTDINGKRVSDGLQQALRGINLKDVKEYKAFGEYLIVRHGPERLAEGMRVFSDDRKNSTAWMNARQSVLEQQYPAFRQAADRLYEFQKKFLQTWGVQTGLVDPESAAQWAERWQYYVPFNRALAKESRIGAKRGFANQNSTIRRARGSGEDFYNPIDNIINNMVKMVNAGFLNSVGAAMYKAILDNDGLAYFIEVIPAPMNRKVYNVSAVKQSIADQVAATDLNEDEAEKVFGIIDGMDDILVQYERGKATGDVITVLIGGKPVYMKVNDPLLLESLTNMSQKEASAVLHALGTVSRFMTANITGLNLIWSIGSNTVRDLGALLTFSKDKNLAHVFSGIFRAYLNSIRKPDNQDPMYKEFLAMGGGSESVYTADKNMTKDIKDKLAGKKTKWLNPLEWIEVVSNIIERGPRYATYKMMRDRGMSPQEAIYESHDITVNFRRGGSISRQVNKAVPFFNAGVQGVDKLLRWITCEDIPKEKRAKAIRSRVMQYFAAFGVLGALQWFINSRDEETKKHYAQLSTYTKNNFWCIPVYEDGKATGKYVTIPKPRELALPSSLVSAILEYGISGNDEAFHEFDEYALGSYLPNLADDAAKGIVGLARGDMTVTDVLSSALGNLGLIGIASYMVANRDFLGKPIESAYYQNLEAKDRYNERTSKLAYAIGQAFNWSPIKIDYFGQNFLGGFWKTQKALFPVGSEEADLSLGLANTYRRDSQYSTDLVNTMYDDRQAAYLAHNSAPDDIGKAITYRERNNMTTFYSRFNKLDGSGNAGTRQIVLDMINDFNKATKEGFRSDLQGKIDALCESTGSTELMCAVMQPYIKDDDGVRHDLTAAEYVEFQGLYNSLYWEYVGTALKSSPPSAEIAVRQANARAVAEAKGIMLSRMGTQSDYSTELQQERAAGLTASDDILFNAALEAADRQREDAGESLRKEDVYAVLEDMDLTDEEREYLFGTQNYSGASNIYKTAVQLNEWISGERSSGRDDQSIAQSITTVYKDLYIKYWLAGDQQSMNEVADKLIALDLRKKDYTPYYTYDIFLKWIEDYITP